MHGEEISEEEKKVIEIFETAKAHIAKIDKIISELPNDKPLFSFTPDGRSNTVPKSSRIASYRKQQELIWNNAVKEADDISKNCTPPVKNKIFAIKNEYLYPGKKVDLSKEQDKAMRLLKEYRDRQNRD
jgi:hypothetical protein